MVVAESPEPLWLPLTIVQVVLRQTPSALACSSSVTNPAAVNASLSCRILHDCRSLISTSLAPQPFCNKGSRSIFRGWTDRSAVHRGLVSGGPKRKNEYRVGNHSNRKQADDYPSIIGAMRSFIHGCPARLTCLRVGQRVRPLLPFVERKASLVISKSAFSSSPIRLSTNLRSLSVR